MATAICLSAPIEFNKILDNPNFADICCRLEIFIFYVLLVRCWLRNFSQKVFRLLDSWCAISLVICSSLGLKTSGGEDKHLAVTMPFTRPSHIALPTIWRRFDTDKGRLRIQDVTEDMREEAMELLTKYFTRDEPPCRFINIHKHPTAVSELQKLWRNTLEDNLSLACVVDDDEQPPKIVGVNVLTVASKEDKEEPFQTEDKVWAQLFGAVDFVGRSVDIFSHYQVDKYLTAYGLVVHPDWRGRSIGKELLLTRYYGCLEIFSSGIGEHSPFSNGEFIGIITECGLGGGKSKMRILFIPRRHLEALIPLCKALDIKVTATVFTAGASQAVAKKAGFVDLSEISYEELAKKGFIFPGIEKDTKASKLMALVIK